MVDHSHVGEIREDKGKRDTRDTGMIEGGQGGGRGMSKRRGGQWEIHSDLI